MRQRLSNLAHRFGHWVDPAAQPLCACRAAFFMEGWRAKARAEIRALARNPEELRELIAASERRVE